MLGAQFIAQSTHKAVAEVALVDANSADSFIAITVTALLRVFGPHALGAEMFVADPAEQVASVAEDSTASRTLTVAEASAANVVVDVTIALDDAVLRMLADSASAGREIVDSELFAPQDQCR